MTGTRGRPGCTCAHIFPPPPPPPPRPWREGGSGGELTRPLLAHHCHSVYALPGVYCLWNPGLLGVSTHGLDIGSFPCSPETSLFLCLPARAQSSQEFSRSFLQVTTGTCLFRGGARRRGARVKNQEAVGVEAGTEAERWGGGARGRERPFLGLRRRLL